MEKVTITQILEKKQNPSQYRPGEMYWSVKFIDQQGRNVYAQGRPAENALVGTVLEGDVTQTTFTNQQGQTLVSFKLNFPKKDNPQFGPRNFWPQAYELAIEFLVAKREESQPTAPLILSDVDQVAVQFHSRLLNGPVQSQPQSAAQLNQPQGIDVNSIPF